MPIAKSLQRGAPREERARDILARSKAKTAPE
jgi:hypothetical protein